MKQGYFSILENVQLNDSVYKMKLKGDVSANTKPGQFVNIKLDGLFLRRPISVCDVEGDVLTIIYKVVGKGTDQLSKMQNGSLDILSGLGNGYDESLSGDSPLLIGKGTKQMSEMTSGQSLDILTGLGNGYDLSKAGDKPMLLGGGVGVPPLYLLAKRLIAQGKKVSVILGFNKKEEVFYFNEFKELGCEVLITTVDGSLGIKGFVTDGIDKVNYSYVYTCGPEPMLKAVYKKINTSGQFSFEERMGCGFGACMGCSCKTLYKNKRICKDGPVLFKEEIIWEN